MKLVTEEMLVDLIKGAKTVGETITSQTVDIVNQALNYSLFEAVIALLGTLSLYLIYYIVSKILSASENANKIEDTEKSLKIINMLKTIRHILLIIFTGIILNRSTSSVKTIGKIMIAPKVFLLEEGVKILEKLK